MSDQERRGRSVETLTQGIWEPKDGVAWEEEGALAGAVAADGARDVKVALADGAGVGLCAFAVCFTVRARPGTTRAAFSNTATGLASGVAGGTRTDGGAEDLEARRDQGLCAFLSDATGFEGPADCSAPLRVGMAPDGQAHAVVGDCAASADTRSGLLLVHGRRGGHGQGAKISGGRAGIGKGVVGVGVVEGGRGGRAVCGENRAPEETNVGRGGGEGGGGGREGESEGVYGAGGLESGGDDLDLAGEGELGGGREERKKNEKRDRP